MKRLLYGLIIMALSAPLAVSAQEYDDIYYNPKKDKTASSSNQKKKKQSYYIKDFENIDVDEYNRRGQYYSSPIDTIGNRVENDEDFVYTQQIQKFYNPTIVVDNSDLLEDVLYNSYGNVEIVFDNGRPLFAPYYGYSWPYYPGYHYGWIDPWYWDWGPAWRPAWAWGPSWTWGPSWNWGWGPSWSWGPSWGWGGHHHHYADYRPGGRLPNRPGSNWASNTRPGGNRGHHTSAGRPVGSKVPSYNNSTFGGSQTNHHRSYRGTSSTGGNRVNSNGSSQHRNNNGYTVNNNGHRTYNNSGTNSNSNRRNSYNNSNSNSNRNSYNSNRSNYNSNRNGYNSNHNNSGSFSTGRGSGSFGGGGHRSSGGGGSRGRHR